MLDSLPGKVTSAGFSGLDATEPPNTYQRAVVNAAKSEGVTEGVIEPGRQGWQHAHLGF